MSVLVGIDIGGTKIAAGVAERESFLQNGKLAGIQKMPVPDSGTPTGVLPHLFRMVEDLVGNQEIEAVGISIGGPLDHREGRVLNFPHLPEWKDVPLRALVSEYFQVPAALDNDANLGALAEYRWGAGRGANPFMYLTISTGIGGGVIVNGELVHGTGSGGGEVGHITVQTDGPLCPCGNRGCLERMASGTNIARHARELLEREEHRGDFLLELAGGNGEKLTSAHVLQGYRNGDSAATEVWEAAVRYMAIGLGSLIHVLAPERIVLGGGVSLAGDDLILPLRKKLRDHVFYVPLEDIDVRTASLGHDSALLGAVTLALDI